MLISHANQCFIESTLKDLGVALTKIKAKDLTLVERFHAVQSKFDEIAKEAEKTLPEVLCMELMHAIKNPVRDIMFPEIKRIGGEFL